MLQERASEIEIGRQARIFVEYKKQGTELNWHVWLHVLGDKM